MNFDEFSSWLKSQILSASQKTSSPSPQMRGERRSADEETLDQMTLPRFPSNGLKPLLMGIVNVTPDSFSDGGRFFSPDKACEHALKLVEDGADLIDIGGESTRPGAQSLPVDSELARVIPVIEAIRRYSKVCLSIDSYKPEVMQAAVSAGANWINDIYALRQEGALEMAARLKVPVCLMHMQGMPQTMQHNPVYPSGVINAIKAFFNERIQTCLDFGIDKHQLLLDPGFGFGKSLAHNLQLVYDLGHFHALGLPILLGLSRKKTLGLILDKEANERLMAAVALTVYAQQHGVGIIRTHDVNETKQVLQTIQALYQANESRVADEST